jgi:cysteine synthase B
VFAGISSGAIFAAAVKASAEVEDGSVIVSMICDGGWKYLSTGAWTGDIDAVTERAKQVIYF